MDTVFTIIFLFTDTFYYFVLNTIFIFLFRAVDQDKDHFAAIFVTC